MPKSSGQTFPVQILPPPTGIGELSFGELHCSERLSEPYAFELTAWSKESNIAADKVLGRPMTVTVEQPRGGERHYSGLVSRFARVGSARFAATGLLHRYQFRLQPWFWFLTRAADCRVFQEKTVPGIFEAVAKERGFSSGDDFVLNLQGDYEKRDYCVQYRETDFNFLARLLEDAGIWYYFRHAHGRHTLVLVDRLTAHSAVSPYDKVAYRPADGVAEREDQLQTWWVEHSVQSGTYSSTDYDFEKPALSLLSKSKPSQHKHPHSSFEVYEYPAFPDQLSPEQVQTVVNLRQEELQARYERFHGEGSCIGLRTGTRFDLSETHEEKYDGSYVIVATEQTVTSNQYMAGQESEWSSTATIEAIKADSVYRPPRTARKPIIHGAQTAVVVGPSGDEIHTDKHGRIKVQFPWDRQGKKDDKSSCWVRVSQAWAGAGWGAIYIPRVGQEVLVSFLEGDPDRPIVTGRVYHGTNVPPYALPDNKTRSTLKSESSKGGGGFNEIRFEDKKGSEEVFVHAQKDMLTKVEHDQTTNIEHDQTHTVKHDRKLTVEHDETRTVKNDHATSIQGNEKRDVSNKRTTKIGDNDALTVLKDKTATVSQSYSLTAGKEISLETGASRLVMKADGTIELVGTKITIKSLDKVTVMATQFKLNGFAMVEVQGAAVKIQGSTLLQLNSSGIASLSGSLTKIG